MFEYNVSITEKIQARIGQWPSEMDRNCARRRGTEGTNFSEEEEEEVVVVVVVVLQSWIMKRAIILSPYEIHV
jgi:hypothetical protein